MPHHEMQGFLATTEGGYADNTFEVAEQESAAERKTARIYPRSEPFCKADSENKTLIAAVNGCKPSDKTRADWDPSLHHAKINE